MSDETRNAAIQWALAEAAAAATEAINAAHRESVLIAFDLAKTDAYNVEEVMALVVRARQVVEVLGND